MEIAGQQCLLPAGLSCSISDLTPNGVLLVNILQTTPTQINVSAVGCDTQSLIPSGMSTYRTLLSSTSSPFIVQCYAGNSITPDNALSIGTLFSGYLIVNYTEVYTGFPHTATGTLLARVTSVNLATTISSTTTATTTSSTISTTTTGTSTSTTSTSTTATTTSSTSTTSTTASTTTVGCTLAGVTGTIQVGGNPYGVAFSPDGTFAYTTNYGPDTLSMISTATNSVVNTIGAGPGVINPDGIAFVPGSSTWAYFADSSGLGTIFVPTNWVNNPINYSIQSYDVQFTPSGSEAYVVSGVGGVEKYNVTVINTATSAVVNTIVLPNQGTSEPLGVGFSPNGNLAYVTDYNSNKVDVINVATNTVINTISVDPGPNGVGFADNNHAYVTTDYNVKLDVINVATNTVTANNIVASYASYAISVSPVGNLALVSTAGNILVINTVSNTVINSITTGVGYTDRIAIAANGKYAYIGDAQEHIGYINIPANTMTAFGAGGEIEGMATDPTSSTYAYGSIYCCGSYGFIRIATSNNAITYATTIPNKNYYWEMAIPSTGGVAYETGYSSAHLNIINLASMSAVPSSVGMTPNAIAVTPGGIAYVVNGGSGTVTVVGPPSAGYPVLATVPVGTDPWARRSRPTANMSGSPTTDLARSASSTPRPTRSWPPS